MQILRNNPETHSVSEPPDGLRVVFSTPTHYVAGTLSLFINGQRVKDNLENGFSENPPNGITTTEAPEATDTLEVQYEPK